MKASIITALLLTVAISQEAVANSRRIIGGVVARSEVQVYDSAIGKYNDKSIIPEKYCPRDKSWYMIQVIRDSKGEVIDRNETYVGCDKSARVYVP